MIKGIGQNVLAFLSLFASMSTLLCCALPALLVLLGAGAVMAGLLGTFPQLVWLSMHKEAVFMVGAVLLAFSGWLEWKSRPISCPVESRNVASCQVTRRWSRWLWGVSVTLYMIGASVVFILPSVLL